MPNTTQLEEDLFEHYRILADPNQALLRIDKFLIDRLPNVTRNRVQQAIKEGWVQVNDDSVKPNYKVRPGDDIRISLPEPPRDTTVIPQNIPLDIHFEDAFLLVVNKPAGMVVHPAYQNWEDTLVNALAWHFHQLPEMEGNEGRPGLVHRIDKDTSGLLVIAKTEAAMSGLAKQFFDHSIDREYLALVWGVPDEPEGTITVNLGRHPKDRRMTTAFPIGDLGKTAITHYKLEQDLRYVSLLSCKLETGRTHQIRAHMKYLKHPIFNDVTYGGKEILRGTVFTKYKQYVQNCFAMLPGQALHARSLGFQHPVLNKSMHFEVDPPAPFQELIHKWENYVQYND